MNYEREGIAPKRREESDGFSLDRHARQLAEAKTIASQAYHARIVERCTKREFRAHVRNSDSPTN